MCRGFSNGQWNSTTIGFIDRRNSYARRRLTLTLCDFVQLCARTRVANPDRTAFSHRRFRVQMPFFVRPRVRHSTLALTGIVFPGKPPPPEGTSHLTKIQPPALHLLGRVRLETLPCPSSHTFPLAAVSKQLLTVLLGTCLCTSNLSGP